MGQVSQGALRLPEIQRASPQKARMRPSLNIPIEALHDERGLAWDVSGKGHCGSGPTEVGLAEDDDFTYVMGLVRQAFEYQMGGD